MKFEGESALSQTPEQLNQSYATREVSDVRKEARELLRCNLKFHSVSKTEARVSKKEKEKKEKTQIRLNKRKTKIKEQKTTLDFASLAPASEKSLSDNYSARYN